VCIIARSKGIPAVIGADITAISDGDILEIECSANHGPEYPEGAVVYANVSNAQEVQHALDLGVAGIGLFRTEFLLMQREFVPDEQNQYNVYVQAARLCGNKPLIIRTLDLGGDKVLPYMPLPSEENPALGLRGIRLTLSQPDLFKIQLRALLRASTEGDIRIMLPMVSSLDEVRQTKEMLQCCATDLAAEGVPFRMPKLGVMIETPAAVFLAEELARETDFFSIGTNDLVQYLLAADRGNNAVAYLYSAVHPAVLKAVRMVVEGARRAKGEDFPIEVCGEAASQRESISALWECGIRQFSVSSSLLVS
jgi:phosphotransferase system enzyme I (PtsI)